MVTRLAAPPLNIGPSFIRVIDTIVLMKRVRVGDRVARRVAAVYEILPEPKPGYPRVAVRAPGVQDEVEYAVVFDWDPRRDEHSPAAPEELAKRAPRLRAMAEGIGWDEARLVEELTARMELIQRLVDKRAYDWKTVYEELRRFHAARRRTAP